ncbi:hypothetical protein GCM10022197_12720 [Microlunatus spumicola]|uniref:Uncharacterized protein n=1 Tax=Microlunatus spumicola TaxID=81499 RepID=A0ABP6X1D2_9ACTN
MTGRARDAWFVAGLLLAAAGVLTAVSYAAHWSPCAGDAFRSELCSRRRDTWLVPPFMADPGDRVPWVTGPVAVASLLAGLSWPAVLRALPLRRPTRVVGLLLALQTVSIGVWSVVSAFTPLIDPEAPIQPLWWVGGEVLAVVFVLLLVLESDHEPRLPGSVVWAVVAVVGATTFGLVRFSVELMAFGGHLGDGYPRRGAGFGLAATLLLCGAALVVRSRLAARVARPARSEAVGLV